MNDFAAWLAREMPAGTVIADPLWWASRIRKALDAEIDEMRAERDALQVLLAECYAELTSNLSQIMNDYENIPPDGEGMVEAKLWIDRLTDILARIDAAVKR